MLNLDVRPDTTFSEFVGMMYESWVANGKQHKKQHLNSHFDPMSSQCNLDQGFQYTYYLKVEEQHLWYKDFVGMMNLTSFVASGWEGWRGRKGRDSCFYAPKGMSCKCFHSKKGCALAKPAAGLNPLYRTWHSTGSTEKIDTYYTVEAAQQVSEMYAEDLRMFNYPVWSPKKKKGKTA